MFDPSSLGSGLATGFTAGMRGNETNNCCSMPAAMQASDQQSWSMGHPADALTVASVATNMLNDSKQRQ
jgi:hypothetical protein